jgi:hypothetical protein
MSALSSVLGCFGATMRLASTIRPDGLIGARVQRNRIAARAKSSPWLGPPRALFLGATPSFRIPFFSQLDASTPSSSIPFAIHTQSESGQY